MSTTTSPGGAVVTGGSGALGTAIARALLNTGSPVTLVARRPDRLQAAASKLSNLGEVHVISADVTIAADRRRIITEALDSMGSISVLVNNAGAEFIGRLDHHQLPDVEHMVQMNLVAPIELTRGALRHLEATGGHVVNIVTMAAKTPMTPMSVYAATKAGLGRFSELLDLELADSSVSASAVYPGAIADEGMFAMMQAETGVEFPKRMPVSSPDWVAHKVLKAIQKRRREIYAAPSGALMARHPGLAGRMLAAMGVADAFAEVADTRARQRPVNAVDLAT